jgi:L-amino acid N-acyltransferase YncA
LATLDIRRAVRDDYANILQLENENYVENVPASQRKDGFLSAKMTEAQLDRIATDLGVAVAYDDSTFLGFFSVSRMEHWPLDSVVHRLVESLRTHHRDERVTDPNKFCIFGPMCVSPLARGKGVLPKLYECAVRNLKDGVTTAAGFISVHNPRSLQAISKLNWQPVGKFTWSDREFHAFIRNISENPNAAAPAGVNLAHP